MGDIEKKEDMPVLTLEAVEDEAKAIVKKGSEPFAPDKFTPAELEQINTFAQRIDLKNSNMILQYGANIQAKSADFSETVLKNVKTKDMGEMGELLSDLVSEMRGFGKEEKRGFLGLFKKTQNKIEALKNRYAKTEVNVNKVSNMLESHQFVLLKDIATMDKLYDQNKQYFKELSMYIAAGKKKLDETRAGELVELQKKAQESGLPEDAQAADDLASMCDRFEKKIYDLELTRTITLQTAPQIRLVQENDTLMSEKIQSTLVNSIPLWKNQMVLALGSAHASEAAKAQKLVTDATNDMLKKNAEMLHDATVSTAEEYERGIVDIETLQQTNEKLITTIDEVLRIQTDGQQKRRAAEAELTRIEEQLKAKLLESSRATSSVIRTGSTAGKGVEADDMGAGADAAAAADAVDAAAQAADAQYAKDVEAAAKAFNLDMEADMEAARAAAEAAEAEMPGSDK